MPYPLVYEPLVRAALLEDLGRAGDLTTDTVVPADATARARFVARHPGRVAGLTVSLSAFRLLDPGLSIETLIPGRQRRFSRRHPGGRIRPRPPDPVGGAHRAQSARPPVRHRDRHARAGSGGGGLQGAHHLHPQDDPRPACPGERGRASWRRQQSSLRPG